MERGDEALVQAQEYPLRIVEAASLKTLLNDSASEADTSAHLFRGFLPSRAQT